ncbi:hypothetical protein N8I77_012649 [Diaporthe amygdali]|uniref:Uncharacterized protein n=1 Tax=Phomopsis amygdali TaxID=1214568 RepID=A0AAD9S357_PHOAM|nr:hypothetical protein N8I77_012649 [Diaporthe amygdali]
MLCKIPGTISIFGTFFSSSKFAWCIPLHASCWGGNPIVLPERLLKWAFEAIRATLRRIEARKVWEKSGRNTGRQATTMAAQSSPSDQAAPSTCRYKSSLLGSTGSS